MIKSMTGFGKATVKTKGHAFVSELRTLNHKFLEITPKLPNSLGVFEDRVKALVKNKIRRGKIYLNLTHDTSHEVNTDILIDEKLARTYCNKLRSLKKRLNVEGAPSLADIISFPGVINSKLTEKNVTKLWPSVKEVIGEALEMLVEDREREGSFLFADLTSRVKKIKKIILSIKRNATHNVRNYKKRLQDRIKELSGGYAIDKGRLEVEVALFAKNSDITEELTRLDNHLHNFTKTIRKPGEVGKKLDFIAQELHREINTIGSKSSGFNISKGAIEIKTEIEKIREQLKNIE